jgi:hypothetical protein
MGVADDVESVGAGVGSVGAVVGVAGVVVPSVQDSGVIVSTPSAIEMTGSSLAPRILRNGVMPIRASAEYGVFERLATATRKQ